MALGALGSLSAPLSQELKALSQRVEAGEFPTPLSSAASTPARQPSGRTKAAPALHSTAAGASLNTLGEDEEEEEEDEEEEGLAPLPQGNTVVTSRTRKDSGTAGPRGARSGQPAAAHMSLANRPPPQVLEEEDEEEEEDDDHDDAEQGAVPPSSLGAPPPRPQGAKPTFRNPPAFAALGSFDEEENDEDEDDNAGYGGAADGAGAYAEDAAPVEDVYDNMEGLARRASKAAARVPLHDSDSEDEDGDAMGNLTTMSSLGNTTVLPPLDPEVQGVTDIIMNDLEELFAAVEEWRPNDIVCVTTGVVRGREAARCRLFVIVARERAPLFIFPASARCALFPRCSSMPAPRPLASWPLHVRCVRCWGPLPRAMPGVGQLLQPVHIRFS